MHGGNRIAEVFQKQGINTVFTLCGGHISPIIVACKQQHIRVIDTRHEATAVFAADAMGRLTGTPGVAVVTAGPGATNTVTAVKNAQLAQSPLVLISGAAATALRGRGALQDIGTVELFKPVVKWSRRISRVKNLVPVLEQAFATARSGVPGPVLVECPVDLLYSEALVRKLYNIKSPARSMAAKLVQFYLNRHVNYLFGNADHYQARTPRAVTARQAKQSQIEKVSVALQKCKRPLLLMGSQTTTNTECINELLRATTCLKMPVYLTGMARGLLGKHNAIQLRHRRREALKEADLVITAGVPCDFRLDYGNHINSNTFLIAINKDRHALRLNRKPNCAILADPGQFIIDLAKFWKDDNLWPQWLNQLQNRDHLRENQINDLSIPNNDKINALDLLQQLNAELSDESIIVADGGDFIASASYIVKPPKPLSWLDPGVFGTLGVGAGFALAAKICNPLASVWLLYGDGALGYSMAELDTFVRHKLPIIAVVGNDASWSQVARDQVELLKDDIGTCLSHNNYHLVAEGLGALGMHLDNPNAIKDTLKQAQTLCDTQQLPVLINAILANNDFRKGSISI